MISCACVQQSARLNNMTKVSIKDLEKIIALINKATNNPSEYRGEFKPNIGHYHLDSAYGGYKMVQTTNEGGGVRAITNGYVPKRDLYNELRMFLQGIYTGQGK
jgi:hypothetical protein